MWKLVLLLAALAAVNASDLKAQARNPKLFFVTSSTSTSISTTTSTLGTQFTCFMLSSTTYTLCTTGRKKRAVIDDTASSNLALEPPVKVSRVQRDVDTASIESGKDLDTKNNRKAKFAWYYMTTTVTRTSTFTSTSTTFTATLSISLQGCTPATFNACGK